MDGYTSGGLAIKHKGRFKKQELKPAPQFIEYKVTAMKRKADYLFRNKGSKNAFLDMFTMFSDQLQSNYKSFEIDSLSKILLSNIDIHILKEKRRENASYLYEELKNCDFIKPIIKEPDFANDCPLYLPIKVETKFRNDLRDYLIAKRIYCPIHWPIPNINCLNKATKRIYEEELSLVCDQRYGIDDMRRIVKTIGEFWRRLC